MPSTPSSEAAPKSRHASAKAGHAGTFRDPQALRRLLETEGHEIGRDGKLLCPLHSERTASCQLYDDPRGGHLHCFGCGAHLDAYAFMTDHLGLSPRVALDHLEPHAGKRLPNRTATRPSPDRGISKPLEPRPLPAPLLAAHQARAAHLDRVPAALAGRSFELDDLRRLGVASEGDSAVLPITSATGEVLRLKLRRAPHEPGMRYTYCDGLIDAGAPAWCSPRFGGAALCLVIEGELNAMASWLARPELDVVGVAGSNAEPPYKALAQRRVVVYGDGDEAGRRAVSKWAAELHRIGCAVSILPPWPEGDACDVAGQLGREELRRRLS